MDSTRNAISSNSDCETLKIDLLNIQTRYLTSLKLPIVTDYGRHLPHRVFGQLRCSASGSRKSPKCIFILRSWYRVVRDASGVPEVLSEVLPGAKIGL